MGDNIVKHIKGYELQRKQENYKVYAKSFSDVKILYMEDYVKPTPGEMPTHIILYPETNGLPSKKDPDRIAECMQPLRSKESVMSQYQTSQQETINTRGKHQM